MHQLILISSPLVGFSFFLAVESRTYCTDGAKLSSSDSIVITVGVRGARAMFNSTERSDHRNSDLPTIRFWGQSLDECDNRTL